MDLPRAKRHSPAEQRLALSLAADAIRSGKIRTFKQLEKLGFVYRPGTALVRPAPRKRASAPPAGVRGLR